MKIQITEPLRLRLRGKEIRTSLRSGSFKSAFGGRRSAAYGVATFFKNDFDVHNLKCCNQLEKLSKGTQPRRMTSTDPQQALAMIEAFESVGVTAFDISLIDIHDKPKAERETRTPDELKQNIAGRLERASRGGLNLIVRPRSTAPLLIQLDDIDAAHADKVRPHAFMTVATSPKGQQLWLAVTGAPEDGTDDAKQFKKRVKAGAGAGIDKWATGAVRLAGSINLKPNYAPDFPVVRVSQAKLGHTVTAAELDAAGFIASPDAVTPPRSVPKLEKPKFRADAPRYWPDYQQALRGGKQKKDGTGPDRSLVDFIWAKWAAERGWQANEIAYKLSEVSEKAKERSAKGDNGYAEVTAQNAVGTVQRDRSRGRGLKAAAVPRH